MNPVEDILKDLENEVLGNEDSLEHFGVPGMKWGVRKVRIPKTSKKVNIKQLSNAELKKRTERNNLEINYKKSTKKPLDPVTKIVALSAGAVTTQQLIKRGNKIVDKILGK